MKTNNISRRKDGGLPLASHVLFAFLVFVRGELLFTVGALPDARLVKFKLSALSFVHAVAAVFRSTQPTGPEVTFFDVSKPSSRVLGVHV
jgi:hypothetical protein